MITKGIIQAIDLTGNTCQVRMPFFESANNDEIYGTATISNTPGSYNGYKVGDVVWVAFEDNKLASPVVIGKLYLGVDIEQQDPRGVINVVDSVVANSASIPADTKLDASVENNVAPTSIPHNSVSSISHNLSKLNTNVNSMATEYNNEFRLVAARLDEDGERIAGLTITADEIKQYAIGVENEVKKEVWARIAGDSNLLKNIKSVKQYFDSELSIKADDIKAEVRSNFLLKDSTDAEIEETYAFGWDLQFDKWTVYSKKESSQGLNPNNVHLSIKQEKAELKHGLGPGTYYFTNNQGWQNVYCFAYKYPDKTNCNKAWPGEICPVVGVNKYGEKYHSAVIDSYEFDTFEFNAGRDDLKTDEIKIIPTFYAIATAKDVAYDSKFEVEESGNYIFNIDANNSIDAQQFIGPVPTEGEPTNYRCIVNGEELENLLDIKSSISTNNAEIILTLKKGDTVIFLQGAGSVDPLDFHRWETIEEYIHSDLNAVYLKDPVSGRPTIPVGFWAARDLAIGNEDATVYVPYIAINGQATKRIVTDVESLDSFKQLLIAENGYWAWKDITDQDLRNTGVIASEVKDILTASEDGLKVNGRIEATDGYIGSFIIGSVRPEDFQSAIHSDSYIEKFSDNVGTRTGIYLGTDGIALGNWQWPDGGRSPAFKVDTLGNLIATRGQFGYLYIGETHWTNGYPHSGLYSKNYVHSFDGQINEGDCGIYLGSDGINLGNWKWPNGGVSAAFSVDPTGYLKATQGLIGLWNIGPAHTIGDGTIEFSGIYSTGYITRFDQSIYSGQSGLYLGTDGIKLGNYVWPDGGVSAAFSVTPGGELQCTHGHIGTFLIGGKHKVGNVTHSSIHTENYVDQFDWDIHPNNPGVYIGTDGIRLGSGDKEFAVDAEGNIKAESLRVAKYIRVDPYFGAEDPIFEASADNNYVKMAGFTVTDNYMSIGYMGQEDSVFVSSGSELSASIAGSTYQRGWAFTAGRNFGVNADGQVFCKDAHITGEINATTGKIGNNLEIDSDGISVVNNSSKPLYKISREGIVYTNNAKLQFINVMFEATTSGSTTQTYFSDLNKSAGLRFDSTGSSTTSEDLKLKVELCTHDWMNARFLHYYSGVKPVFKFTLMNSSGTPVSKSGVFFNVKCTIRWGGYTKTNTVTLSFSSSSVQTISVPQASGNCTSDGESFSYIIEIFEKSDYSYAATYGGTYAGSFSFDSTSISGKNQHHYWDYINFIKFDGTQIKNATNGSETSADSNNHYDELAVMGLKITKNTTTLYCLSHFNPVKGGTYDLGATNNRWRDVWAGKLYNASGEVTGSDRKIKKSISYDISKYDSVFDNLKPATYIYKDNTSNRTHIGFIAQDLQKSIFDANLTRKDFGGLVISGEGFNAKTDTITNENTAEYGIIYSELHALEVRQIQLLKKRVTELEDIVAKLESKIKED